MPDEKRGKSIQSVQRAIDIINCFNEINVELSLTQISDMVGLNRSTVHGILNTLHQNGFIRRSSDSKYLLGQTLLLKHRYAQSAARLMLIDIAKPHMARVAEKHKLTANLFIIESWRPYHLLQELPLDAVYTIHHVSDQDPLYCTATGKIVLAHMAEMALDDYLARTELKAMSTSTITIHTALKENLAKIRLSGYSFEREELGEGVSAVSVPIYNREGELYGAVSVTGVAYTLERCRDDAVADLQNASKRITDELFLPDKK